MSEKRKKALLVVAFISIFTIGIFAGRFIAWISEPDKRIIYEAQLNGALRTAKKYELKFVYLKDLTDFDWEKVCVITPYILPETIKQRAGVEYYDFTDHDGQWGLLFIDKNKKLIPIRINAGWVGALALGYSDAKKYKFEEIEGAVYCANKDNAKLAFHFEKILGGKTFILVSQ